MLNNLQSQKYVVNSMFITLTFSFLYFSILYSSAFIFIPTTLIVFSLMRMRNLSVYFSLLIAILFIGTVASFKTSEGDLIAYERYFTYVSESTIYTVLFEFFSSSSIRVTEFIFKLHNIFLSSLGMNFIVFHSVTVSLIYLAMFFFGLSVLKVFPQNRGNILFNNYQDKVFVILWIFLVGVSFTLTSQVLKQYLSIAFMAVGFAYILKENKILKPSLLFLLSIFTHNASIILMALVLTAYMFQKAIYNFYFKIFLLILAFILGFLFTSIIEALGLSALLSYGGMEEANFGITAIFDLILLSVLFAIKKSKNKKNIELFFAVIFVFICFMIFVREIPILFLRIYFYMEIFRIFAGIYIYKSLNSKDKNLLFIFIIFFGPIYWNLKLFSSSWDYGLYTLTDNFIRFLSG